MEFHPRIKPLHIQAVACMNEDELAAQFEQLSQRYDEQYGTGATLRLKDELGLGHGQFNEVLTIDDIETLLCELSRRIPSTSER